MGEQGSTGHLKSRTAHEPTSSVCLWCNPATPAATTAATTATVCCHACHQIEELEAEGILEQGTAPEIATYLIISAAQVGAGLLGFGCVPGPVFVPGLGPGCVEGWGGQGEELATADCCESVVGRQAGRHPCRGCALRQLHTGVRALYAPAGPVWAGQAGRTNQGGDVAEHEGCPLLLPSRDDASIKAFRQHQAVTATWHQATADPCCLPCLCCPRLVSPR